ncbi:hypothetical protein [Pseudoruegeria sp. HB172150]|uniref:hypothetical protein n=1 Tax=Pseudoruegeria sp. HB172150 TaxID=2721164 RepID=UPI0015556C02|nr:hypothetical protein [Pseudoruegeria sp. HB172150]
MNLFKAIAVAATLVLGTGAAHAVTVLDTLSTNTEPFDYYTNQGGLRFFNLASYGPVGQSFTLSEETTNLEISAYFSTFGSYADITATLVEGTGLGGAVLATLSFYADATRYDAVLGSFDFSALGALVGDYTIVFDGVGTLGGSTVEVLAPNSYAGVDTPGTSAYDEDGLFNFGSSNPVKDFGIKVEGDPVAPVPLPAGGLLLASALGLVGARRVLRRKA